eukprot:TRINITY_DN18090_c0_g1_i2.p1 TRINITY_DN18090_c0_g1~~TRINITY_DN18090_c0_g1_i2.p1  ORF type:complete len:570 (+),score=101.38 TRINITY_DN18090_c0_g1_i2:132-1841(+)
MAYVVHIEENCVRVEAFVSDPVKLHVYERDVRLTSGHYRLAIPLPVMVYPSHPLNTSKYNRRTGRLVLMLRRPFAGSTWDLFAECDRKFAQMQAEAQRVLGAGAGSQNCLQASGQEEGDGRPGGASRAPKLLPAWSPSSSSARSSCAAMSTLRLTGYPWPGVLETTLAWFEYHSKLGFEPIYLFLDEPDDDKVAALRRALSPHVGSNLFLVEKAEMEAAWREAGDLWDEHGAGVETELTAKQILNSATALRRCQADHPEVEWLSCHLDLDEAFCLFGEDVASHFGAVPSDAWQVVYLNHEAVTVEGAGKTWFEQIDLFKVNPLMKVPFISKRFPAVDTDAQLLRHPDGLGDATLEFWHRRNAHLSEQYGFKKRAGGGTCSYFDGYSRGKVAVRVSTVWCNAAMPREHRWVLGPGFSDPLVCAPSCCAILHYFNCGGADWFEAKYSIRKDEALNRWFQWKEMNYRRSWRKASSCRCRYLLQPSLVVTALASLASGAGQWYPWRTAMTCRHQTRVKKHARMMRACRMCTYRSGLGTQMQLRTSQLPRFPSQVTSLTARVQQSEALRRASAS